MKYETKKHRRTHHLKKHGRSLKGGFSFSSKPKPATPTVAITDSEPGIGNVNFITFIGAVFSRLAYLSDCGFIIRYNMIFGDQARSKDYYTFLQDIRKSINQPPCIQYSSPPVFTNIEPYPIGDCVLNKIGGASIDNIFDDASVFTGMNLYTFEGKQYVNFTPYAKHINYVNGEASETGVGMGQAPSSLTENVATPTPTQSGGANENVKYISVAWSNYSIVYIVADKRMNSIWVAFRGTASPKAAMSYLNSGALYPKKVCANGDAYLSGIFKITTEQIHTILEAMRYLTVGFLNPSQSESVKVFTTGHSLGGGMCTIFSYLWQNIRTKPAYSDNGFDKMTKKIVCISVAAPRVINKTVCDKFQRFIEGGSILYKRVITKGDPVVDLPLQTQGFIHPTNGIEDKMEVVNYCNNLVSVSKTKGNQIFIDYAKPLLCIRKKPSAVILSSIRNPLAHGFYLYLGFYKPIMNFGREGEVSRVNPSNDLESNTSISTADTVCRVIFGDDSNRKVGFFNAKESRGQRIRDEAGVVSSSVSRMDSLKKKFITDTNSQDVLMTQTAFQNLIAGMTDVVAPNVNPNFGTIMHIFDPNVSVENVNCVGETISAPIDETQSMPKVGGRTRRRTQHKSHRRTRR